MKRVILGIVFLLSAIGTSFGQGKPTSEQVVAAIRKQQALDHEENTFQFRIRDEKAIRFIPGKFTGLDREECIAICSTEAGRYVSDYALLMYRTAGGTWTSGRWHSAHQHSLDVVDCNNDGIMEIILEGGAMGQGYLTSTYQLVAISNDKGSILYQNKAEDGSAGAYVMNSKEGEEVSRQIEVFYEDLNKDGRLELIENIAIGLFVRYDQEQGAVLRYRKQKNIYYWSGSKFIIR